MHAFNLRGASMATVSWQGQLNAATAEGDVVGIARDFVAQFDPAEIASLPENCRPWKFRDGQDLTSYAFTLVNHVTGGDNHASLLVEKLAAFFSHAAIRIARLMASANEEREERTDDSRQSA